ncbi:hypothetical protein JY651_49535 [Pyxidicoccus parkwayensis]|jgi:hypothetical protein|uniref:Uncharacterized protein n=1 Tax=Pyxidicoccus parkwayensis TaxID=2813578 RepID=A0ABX7P256_9BACT|nr:hypothetical protein [Pyxidicoccus parkwaysis]QSQ23048.1 hypothetical protein JY651_49535 [Pyxidicoccus parkwaysis]
MGDFYQNIVVRDVSAEDAPRLAAKVRDWLVARRIIEPELSDCSLSGLGHRPGPEYALAQEIPSEHVLHLATNGLQIEVGRRVFHNLQPELTCRVCGARFEPGDDYHDAVSTWFEGDDAVSFACPACHVSGRLTDWDGESPWGLSELGFTFWNWSTLSERFIRELSEQLGRRTLIVRDKL